MSIYVKLEEDCEGPKEHPTSGHKKGLGKVVPPAPPIHVPDDHRFDGYSEALFSTSQEYTRPIKCEIGGKMPSWIDGTFIRVGPGRYEWGETEIDHFFDGDALAHRFTINDGKVEYQSKFLRSRYHRENEKYNRVSQPGIGTWAPPDPCANIFQRILLYFVPNFNLDNTNVNVFEIQGKIYTSTELPWMLEIDKDTLDTIKEINARETTSTTLATWLPHPHFETDGTTWQISVKHFPAGSYQVIKIPPTPGRTPLEGLEVVASMETGDYGAGYLHSFAMTENYIIVIVNPLFMAGLCSMLTMNFRHKTIADLLTFRPEAGTRFKILDKRTKQELRDCLADVCFTFHVGNAYETHDEIIIDCSAYENADLIKMFYLKRARTCFRGETVAQPNLQRYRIPKKEILKSDPEPYRFPIIPEEGRDNEVLGSMEGPVYNYNMVNGKDYTYCYGMAGFIIQPSIVKINVKTKESTYWRPDKDVLPAFPYFIARPGGKEEDDGVLVTNCTGANKADSFLLILDAKTMKEVARATMPVSMAYMFHANYFSA